MELGAEQLLEETMQKGEKIILGNG